MGPENKPTNQTMSDTPRTDEREALSEGLHDEWAFTLCRQLERELNEARDRQWADGIHSCHNECARPMCVLRRERVKTLENALKILMGDVNHLGHWIPNPCRRLVDDALLTNCPDCREFRGHGHECKSDLNAPTTKP